MAVRGKASSKIFVDTIFGLKFCTNVSFVAINKYPTLKLENRQNDRTGRSGVNAKRQAEKL